MQILGFRVLDFRVWILGFGVGTHVKRGEHRLAVALEDVVLSLRGAARRHILGFRGLYSRV